MKKYWLAGLVAVTTLLSPPARAEFGTLDVVPAATLLLPYFEVDIENDVSVRTIFTLRNPTGSAAIAHIMLFTDYGVGTLAFDVVVLAHSQQRFDLKDIIVSNSRELVNDSPVQDPLPDPTEDALFANGFETGDLSGWDGHLSDISIEELRAYHTGAVASRTGKVGGFAHGDSIARGYVLIDSVATAGIPDFPSAPGYFVSGGFGFARNTNIFTGEYQMIDDPENSSIGNAMVHIEASGPGGTVPGDYTFYGRYIAAVAADNREPLATQWNVRINNAGIFNGGTHYIYWRDTKVSQLALTPPALPSWYPLDQPILTATNDDGLSVSIGNDADSYFPLACGRVKADGTDLSLPYDQGFLQIDFSTVSGPIFSNFDQGLIISEHRVNGRFKTGNYGLQLNNAFDLGP
jgi:hypothetical protein